MKNVSPKHIPCERLNAALANRMHKSRSRKTWKSTTSVENRGLKSWELDLVAAEKH